jgi:hypothetical protein
VAAPSKKGKLLLLGGIGVVAVGGAAYLLLSPSSASAQDTPPSGPTVDPRAAKAAECGALQANLVQLRGQPTPDRASMTRLESQLAACLAQARELGVPIDPATDHRATADASRAQIDTWFAEYKGTSNDPLKRNNTRQSILSGGAALAATYTEALAQSPNNETTKLIAQSIVQALDSAVTRKLCFLGNERGCSTHAVDEDQPDVKAAQEQTRVIVPLIAAYMRAVAKVGGPTQAMALADGQSFLAAMMRSCDFLKSYIDGQFAHYRATEWSDALKRNNTRQSILAAGRDLTASLQSVFALASSFRDLPKMRAVGTLTAAAINSSIDRWRCFFSNESGCGTFASNEDQPDAKAAQEMANTTVPLMNLYAQIARALVASGNARAYDPLVTAKLRVCSTLKGYIDGQFAHYKATEYSDALKRNNTRQSMLATGTALANCLREALAIAVSAKTSTDIAPMVRSVAGVVGPALDSAMMRKLCYLFDQPGCGRFALNEDHGNDKAAQEQAKVIDPLIVIAKSMTVADKSNAQAEAPLMRSLLREIEARRDYLDTKFAELKGVSYSDPLRRNNIRDALIASARDMLAGYRSAKPTTPAGRALVRASAQAALQKSQEREACYRSGASGCDRFGWSEPAGGQKADQELAEVTSPLRALLADRSAAGLGSFGGDEPSEFLGMSRFAWGVAAGMLGGAYALGMFDRGPVRRNRRRRTSRRQLTA